MSSHAFRLLLVAAFVLGSATSQAVATRTNLDSSGITDRFGESIQGIGDCNGDGVDDILVGAPGADAAGTDAGAVRVFSGADRSTLLTIQGANAGDEFGIALAALGDQDFDGQPNFAVADSVGVVRVYSGLNGTPIRTLTGSAADGFGTALVGAGDLDGDLREDLVIAAPGALGGAGEVIAVSGLSGSVLWTVSGAGGDSFGRALAGGVDVDRDGKGDVLVGLPGANGGNGAVVLLSGAGGAQLLRHDGVTNAGLGLAIGLLELDLDGDLKPEFAVGLPGDDVAGVDAGSVEIRSGTTGALIREVNGLAAGDQFGFAISTEHDMDGDNWPDVTVGAPGVSQGAGEVVSVSGRTPVYDRHWACSGVAPGDQFGIRVAVTGGDSPLFSDQNRVAEVCASGAVGQASAWRVTRLSEVWSLPGFSGGGVALGVADFDLDGKLDLLLPNGQVISCIDGSVIRVLPNVGGSTSVISDINGDSVPDYVSWGSSGGSQYCAARNGVSGAQLWFQWVQPPSTSGPDTYGVRSIVWTPYQIGNPEGALAVLYGETSGSLAPHGVMQLLVPATGVPFLSCVGDPGSDLCHGGFLTPVGDYDGDLVEDWLVLGFSAPNYTSHVPILVSGAQCVVVGEVGGIEPYGRVPLGRGVDIDGDGVKDYLEYYESISNTELRARSLNGEVLWRVGENIYGSSPSVGDLDGDDVLDHIVDGWAVRSGSGQAVPLGVRATAIDDRNGDGRDDFYWQFATGFPVAVGTFGVGRLLGGPPPALLGSPSGGQPVVNPTNLGVGSEIAAANQHVIVDNTTLEITGEVLFGRLTVRNGGVIRAAPNDPLGVNLNVATSIEIDATSRIDATGRGYPGGQGPGTGTDGASHGGTGYSGLSSLPYGDFRRPTTMGSGGGPGAGSGAGGGVIRIRAGTTFVLDGKIEANATDQGLNSGGGGAGGSIWIRAGGLVGNGTIEARGGGTLFPFGGGSGGRIAIETDNNSFTGPIRAHGRNGASAGTVYELDTQTLHELLVLDNAGWGYPVPPNNWSTFGVQQESKSTYLPRGEVIRGDMIIRNGAGLSCPPGSDGVYLEVVGQLVVEAGGLIHAFERGLPAEQGFDTDPSTNFRSSAGIGSSGAGHGGAGGEGFVSGQNGLTYDNPGAPRLPGSGGGNTGAIGGTSVGGGVIHLRCGSMVLDGAVIARGVDRGNYVGGSSGGSIWISGALSGQGLVDARGGDSYWQLCGTTAGAGGGGLIRLGGSASFSGTTDVSGGSWSFNGCYGLNQWGGNGQVVGAGGGVALVLPGSIDGSDDFDALTVGTAPNAVDPVSGELGAAGAWSFPAGYQGFVASESVSIVPTSSFDLGSAGNSLEVLSTGLPTFVAGQLRRELAARPNGIVRVNARVWAGPGLFSIGRATGAVHANAPVADMGATIEWLSDGRIVAWTAGLSQSVDLVPSQTWNQWQQVQLDLDLSTATFDFWWAPAGQALQLLVQGVPFATVHDRVDRLIVGGRQGESANFRIDDVTVSDDWCELRGVAYGVGLAGLGGVPSIDLQVASRTEVVLGNAAGVPTIGLLGLGWQSADVPLFGGRLLIAPTVMLGLSVPAGGMAVDLLPRVMPVGFPRAYLQFVHIDISAPEGIAMSRGLAVLPN